MLCLCVSQEGCPVGKQWVHDSAMTQKPRYFTPDCNSLSVPRTARGVRHFCLRGRSGSCEGGM